MATDKDGVNYVPVDIPISAVKEPTETEKPDNSYLIILLDHSVKAYYQAIVNARNNKNELQEMYYRGKHDGMAEACRHTLELSK